MLSVSEFTFTQTIITLLIND